MTRGPSRRPRHSTTTSSTTSAWRATTPNHGGRDRPGVVLPSSASDVSNGSGTSHTRRSCAPSVQSASAALPSSVTESLRRTAGVSTARTVRPSASCTR
ncbi:Uncharacterised protein [Mycobacteroides abscessus]|nr:Uncharacterised protein [Mycobacteroides abscessus]